MQLCLVATWDCLMRNHLISHPASFYSRLQQDLVLGKAARPCLEGCRTTLPWKMLYHLALEDAAWPCLDGCWIQPALGRPVECLFEVTKSVFFKRENMQCRPKSPATHGQWDRVWLYELPFSGVASVLRLEQGYAQLCIYINYERAVFVLLWVSVY